MEGHELLAKMNRVAAPAGFEEGVMAKLAAARKERARIRRANFRYAFAGTAGLILIGFLLLNPSLFQKKEATLTFAEREALTRPSIPVFETMDYASEFRNAQSQPRTVYILEQVSDSVSSEIIY
ncbi:MAG: hypothetical protein NT147_09645 [Candidatus Aminicenantes bacterium]|nr:hypothetical protein [Candidatus Aminicenantes bacterium]